VQHLESNQKMDEIELYVLFKDVLDAMRVVNIEGMSSETDKAALMQSWALLERVAKKVVEDHNGALPFTAAYGASGPKGEGWNIQLNMTIEARTKES
jgi:hypothetical protein